MNRMNRKVEKLFFSPSVLKTLMVAVISILIISTLHAQQAGRWVGRTSQGLNIEFVITPEGELSSYFLDFLIDCESGLSGEGTVSVMGRIPIEDQSFTTGAPPRDGGPYAYAFAGEFISNTEARGSSNFIIARLRVEREEVSSQLCKGDNTWSATWQEPAGGEKNDPPASESTILFYTDKDHPTQVVYSKGSSK